MSVEQGSGNIDRGGRRGRSGCNGEPCEVARLRRLYIRVRAGVLQSHREAETACLNSDVQMPNMSGVELQADLANRGFRIPTIFMTAFPNESVRRRAMAAGAVGFLHKPFNGKALIQFIHDAISQGGGKA